MIKKQLLTILAFIFLLSANQTIATQIVKRNDGGRTCNSICSPKSCVIVGYNVYGTNSQWHADVGAGTGGAVGQCNHNLALANWMNCRCCLSPTNGGWTTYSWGTCNKLTGTKIGYRSCTNPSPNCGGANCSGSSTTTGTCLVNGSCGTADGDVLITAPTINLCSAGSASTVTDSDQWKWTCFGFNGGTDSLCTASKPFLDIGLKINENGITKSIAVWPDTVTVPEPHLKIFKNGVSYKIVLLDPNDPNALKLSVQTSSGKKSLMEFK